MTGLAMIGVAVVLFVIAIPRRGEVVGFLRGRDGLQAFYAMGLLFLLAVGIVITLFN
jgi:hypothetical protein